MNRILGVRRTMTPNQIVAYNLAKARAMKGWTQYQATQHLRDFIGSVWSAASYSSIERSIVGTRVKQFSTDELVGIARAFDLPLAWFFVPPPASEDVGVVTPDGGLNGMDPLVMLDVLLGTPDNVHHLEEALAEYTAGVVPPVKRKRNQQPAGLIDRLGPLTKARSRSIIDATFGDLAQARAFVERLSELVEALDGIEPDAIPQPRTSQDGA